MLCVNILYKKICIILCWKRHKYRVFSEWNITWKYIYRNKQTNKQLMCACASVCPSAWVCVRIHILLYIYVQAHVHLYRYSYMYNIHDDSYDGIVYGDSSQLLFSKFSMCLSQKLFKNMDAKIVGNEFTFKNRVS